MPAEHTPDGGATRRYDLPATVGWSLITSGLATLLLAYLPGDSVYWGLGLLGLGIAVFVLRR